MTKPSPTFSRNAVLLLTAFMSFFISSCSIPESPEKFFDIAVLNSNMFTDFASPNLARYIELETKEYPDIPSSKKKGDEAQTFVNNKIAYMDQAVEKVKNLTASNDEEKEIKQLSLNLYALILPVYKNEYQKYAKLCDTKGSAEEKNEIIKNIDEKYGANFDQQFTNLMDKAKVYAEKHNIQVNWGS
ncbi:hypothetical protein ACJVDH_10275 [Pedobacter sp. AW1-32]|uniref:hypothetical protein n=1 Tax=Pedobacter sp. AW1-32 TaxID=3383026 RepID=UPI003FEF7596